MQKFVRRHQKKFLALFTVGLMVTFAINSGNKSTNKARNETIIAQTDDGPVYGADKEQAEQEWRLLERYLGQDLIGILAVSPPPDTDPSMWRAMRQNSEERANAIVQDIQANPETFLLLVREARKAGVRASGEIYQSVTEQTAPYMGQLDDDTQALFHEALTDLLLIRANFERVASNIKISQPTIENSLASSTQSMKLDVVPISSGDFASKIPAPTPQQIADQFKRFANVDPTVPDPTGNPFGFGYRLPERVKIQYFKIDRASAQAVIDGKKSAYDWDVEARKYYYAHPTEFASTQPASTQPSSDSPAVKPFAEVHQDALNKVKEAMIMPLMAQAQNRLTTMLNADWRTWSSSATTVPTAASLAMGDESYPTYLYMRKPAKAVYNEFQVTVEPNEVDNNQNGRSYLYAPDLAGVTGIGMSSLNPDDQQHTNFPLIVMKQLADWLKRPDRDSATARADLLKPSQPLEDDKGNIYIYRITDARPAEPPSSIDQVASQIDADLRKAAGYQLAKEAGTQLLTAAKTTSLKSAANGKVVFPVDTRTTNPAVIGLTPQDAVPFITQAEQLLGQYNPATNPHPTVLIDLPTEGKVYIAQLTGVSAPWSRDTYTDYYTSAAAKLRYGMELQLQEEWYGKTITRNGYKPTNPKNPAS
jgi:hypothetical protein